MKSWLAPITLAALLSASTALADDVQVEGESVTLSALVPMLAGTDMGELVVAKAPRAGESGWIRASEVRAALKAAGHTDQGLALPAKVRVVRVVPTMEGEELKERIVSAISEKLSPCSVVKVSQLGLSGKFPRSVPISIDADVPRSSGRVSFQVQLGDQGEAVRLHGQVELTCPEPVVMPGASVRIVATFGNVRVSAQGLANQAGRVGDIVRVTNGSTKRSMAARVIDSQTVEVVQ